MQTSFKKYIGWVALVWSLPPILATIGILNRTPDRETSAEFLRTLALQAVLWYPWIALTWLIWRLLRRWPLRPPKFWQHLALHGLCAALLALVLQTYLIVLELWLAKGFATAFALEAHVQAWSRVSPGSLLLQMVLYAMVVASGMALNFYRRSKQQSLQWANDRLQMLAQQLQPHFLFNTLHNIAALVDKDASQAKRILAKLSHLLRASLDKAEAREISLAEELELLDHYLAIQKVRFSDRLILDLAIAEEALPGQVPPLLLQPLVENAIRHGLAKDGGRIAIRAEKVGTKLIIKVCDEGPGFKVFEGSSGIGLANCRARLDTLYGSTASLQLRNLPAKGAEVKLTMPFRSA